MSTSFILFLVLLVWAARTMMRPLSRVVRALQAPTTMQATLQLVAPANLAMLEAIQPFRLSQALQHAPDVFLARSPQPVALLAQGVGQVHFRIPSAHLLVPRVRETIHGRT
jgi:hypothetical protein